MRPPTYRQQETGAPAGLLGRIRSEEHQLFAPAAPSIPAPRAKRNPQARAAFAKLMVTMIVVAAIASLASSTFASFNAVTQNSGNTFQTGTVLLSATEQGSAACYSYGVSGSSTISNNNVNTCPAITFAGVASGGANPAIQGAAKPNDSVHAHMTLQNVGSLNASQLLTYSTGTATCTTANNPNTSQHGTATDICSAELQLSIQEYTSSSFATPVSGCIFPVDASNACTSSPSYPVTLGSFTQHIVSGTGATAPITISNGLQTATPRYFDVVVSLPASAPNTYQGLQAQFDLIFQVAA